MRVAVVGSGISGLVSAYLLSRRNEVTVFEANDYAGGHTHTVKVEDPTGPIAVDTGFIVFNDWTYPNFIRLMQRLGVGFRPTSMSFSVHCERTGLEYNGTTLNTLFAQRRNLLRPRFYRMIREILRFNRESRSLLSESDAGATLGEYLDRQGYGEDFARYYLIPMGAAIWSAPPAQTAAMPARYFVEFFDNHGMLSVNDRPQWRVIEGGSSTYVAPLSAPFRDRLRLSTPVERIRRLPDGVEVTPRGGPPERYDALVMACHSNEALALLADPSDAEREILGAIGYQENDVVLHTDAGQLPRRRLAWASWNYRLDGRGEEHPAAVTYLMNLLQGFDAARQYCVTLNRGDRVPESAVLARFKYAHPLYTPAAVAAQRRRDEVSGVNRTYYCGAYWGWGFHEDGVVSALDVARRFGESLD